MLSQLVYTSEIIPAAFRLDKPLESELEKMLEPTRRRNRDLGVTGLLIYSGGHFLQILEGSQDVIEQLFVKIKKDKRHRNVQQLSLLSCEKRLFSKWSMGLLNLDERRVIDPLIYNRFQQHLHDGVTEDEIAEPLYAMLVEFKTYLDAGTPVVRHAYRRSFSS